MYGKLRRSDFLPVGEEKEDEDVERGYESMNSSDSEYNGERDYEQLRMQPQDGDSGSEYDSDDEREYRGQCSFHDEIEKGVEEGEYDVENAHNAADWPDLQEP